MRTLLKTIFLQTAERAVMYLEFDNFSATETSCGIEILPEIGLSVTISTDKYTGFDIIKV